VWRSKDIYIIEVKYYIESIIKKIESRKNEIYNNIYINYRNTFYNTCLEYIKEGSNPTLSIFNGIMYNN